MKRTLTLVGVIALVLVAVAPAALANNRGGNGNSPIVADHIWVDGELYDTILLGSLPYNGNNGHSFNTIYPVFMPDGVTAAQLPVAPYSPGDREYRGGRWVPEPAVWTQEAVDDGLVVNIESIEELHALEHAGLIVSLGEQPQLAFECPLLPND